MRGGQAPSAARESRGVTFVAGSAPVERPTEPGARVGPVIAEVDLRHSDRGYCLALRDGGGRLDVRVGSGEWAVSEEHGVPVAASGAWDDTDAFVADLVFLETPHRVRISCSVPGRALTVRW